MKIPPKFELTSRSIYYLTQIEASRAVFENTKIPDKLKMNLTRQSLLLSALYSAKIEGNKLNLNDAENLKSLDPTLKERIEVENILSAFAFLQSKKNVKIDLDFILKLHAFVMKNLQSKNEIGKIRKEPSAVFNQAGIAVYISPNPTLIPKQLNKLIIFINKDNDILIPVKAFLSHLIFEKIHPFEDGNGRVGRLLVQTILSKGNYHFNYLFAFEKMLNDRKIEYYEALDKNNPSLFLEFMLEVMFEKLKELKVEILSKDSYTDEDTLLPRRREILNIIKDHSEISLESIQRRFFKVPARTLRYDLKKLEKEGYISKIGSTRGALYKSK